MIDGKSVLAVIPARHGSKRVPHKNLREYRGKSLLAWAIEEGKKSKYIDLLVVSTDDLEILGKALKLWCAVLVRPDELATDTAKSEDVLRHVMSKTDSRDWVVLLQPTSPKRTVEDIDTCIELAQKGDGCISTYQGKTNGAVYVAKSDWIREHDFAHNGLLTHEMPEDRSLDIDHEEDFLK